MSKINGFVWWQFIICLIFGLLLGAIVYILVRHFHLKSSLWYILFVFMPPIIGGIIYACLKRDIKLSVK